MQVVARLLRIALDGVLGVDDQRPAIVENKVSDMRVAMAYPNEMHQAEQVQQAAPISRTEPAGGPVLSQSNSGTYRRMNSAVSVVSSTAGARQASARRK
jgi:hypothetical protein